VEAEGWIRPYYLDASALVKLVAEEQGSGELRHFFEEQSTMLTTSLCVGEALGVLKGKHLHKSPPDQEAYFTACYQLIVYVYYPQPRIQLEDLPLGDFSVLREAEEMTKLYPIDLSDALQLVTLKSGRFRSFAGPSRPMLVTGDGDLLKAAKKEGLLAWDVCHDPRPKAPSGWQDYQPPPAA
jgi:predicted nucleic acid-binding protein